MFLKELCCVNSLAAAPRSRPHLGLLEMGLDVIYFFKTFEL